MNPLESRLARIEARTQIIDLIHSYCRAADRLDPPSMLAHFADDCRVSYVVGEPWLDRAALADMLGAYLPNTVSSQHMITNEEIVFASDDEAVLHTYMYSWQRYRDFPMRSDTHRFGRYECRVVRTADGWRFTHMLLVSAGELGEPRIGEQLARPWPPAFEAA
ncbi:MAG: nuclear transport factor 2 family protein [Sphingomonadales bacterium]